MAEVNQQRNVDHLINYDPFSDPIFKLLSVSLLCSCVALVTRPISSRRDSDVASMFGWCTRMSFVVVTAMVCKFPLNHVGYWMMAAVLGLSVYPFICSVFLVILAAFRFSDSQIMNSFF